MPNHLAVALDDSKQADGGLFFQMIFHIKNAKSSAFKWLPINNSGGQSMVIVLCMVNPHCSGFS
jgi:hypothetical protein